MKNVLFITESYHYAPSPNGNCVKKIAQELVSYKNNVIVLALKNQFCGSDEVIDGVNVLRVPSYLEWRIIYAKHLPNIIKRICQHAVNLIKMVMIPWHPFRSPAVYLHLVNRAKKIIKTHNIDTVVGVYRDFETMYAAYKIKKLYPDLKLIIYSLDAISGGVCSNKLISENMHIKKCRKWEEKILKACDYFCAMNSHRDLFLNNFYDPFRDKIKYMDIPTLDFSDYSMQQSSPDQIRFAYTGMLSQTNADWTFFLAVIPYLQKKRNVRIDVYGAMSKQLEKNLNDTGLRDKVIFFHGRVDSEKLSQVRKETDIFLNFGNEHPCGIPCKVFEYLGTGRLILSFYKIDEDASKPYLEKYEKALILLEQQGKEEEYADQIISFFESKHQKVISINEIEKLYYQNTAKAMCDFIQEV